MIKTSPIRILHTLGWVTGGGVERRRQVLAAQLDPCRYKHLVICQNVSGPIPQNLKELGWEIKNIGLAKGILDMSWHKQAYDIARQFEPEIVHGAVYEGEALACSIGLRMPDVKVIMEETSDPVNRRWTGNLLMRAMCYRADVCVGVSPAVSRYLTEQLHIPNRKVKTINNAVADVTPPTSLKLNELRQALGLQQDDMVVGSVGRIFDEHKRFSDLIKAFSNIKKHHEKAKLLIVGDGPDRAELTRLAQSLGLEQSVIFAGYQAEPRGFYHLMDVFVLASAYEAFGLVLVEAMLAGVPIVATAVGGIPFVLDEGRAGVLIPPSNPQLLAEAVTALLSDTHRMGSLADLGKARALAEFSADRYVREVDDLYRSLVSR